MKTNLIFTAIFLMSTNAHAELSFERLNSLATKSSAHLSSAEKVDACEMLGRIVTTYYQSKMSPAMKTKLLNSDVQRAIHLLNRHSDDKNATFTDQFVISSTVTVLENSSLSFIAGTAESAFQSLQCN